MKHFSYSVLTAAILFLGTFIVSAQAYPEHDPGVKPHAGIDGIYAKFSKAYDDLEPAGVANLYTDDAAYLSPGSDVMIGRDKILSNFTSFFESVKARKRKLDIRFRILQREVGDGLGYDIGIYTITSTGADGTSTVNRGKFVVVTKKGKDGVWRFQVDGFSDLPAK
ncbi:MAG: SgcJ/EcaC family oxidoreductase [Acidobacteriota bacterium]|nr:MAG: SgcJ/EcaC family oxidoreductase [Acidobacteriota bacterium]